MRRFETASLAALGSWFMDVYDETTRNDDDYDTLQEAATIVTDEICERIWATSSGEKTTLEVVRTLMDYHYKAWADASADTRQTRFYEFKAVMVAYDELTSGT